MTSSGSAQKPKLLVLTSTYPRWSGDPEPGFVHELSKRLVDDFDVTVLGPHAAGAASQEVMEGVRVRRYRYAPAVLESLVNDGGIVTNLRRAPWKWLLLPGFLLGLLWSLWRTIVRERPDIIHAHWLVPQGLLVALLGKVGGRIPPFVVTSHGADLFALRSAMLQGMKRFVAQRACAVTVVSPAMLDEMKRIGIDVTNVHIQPMGVDMKHRFTPDPSVQRSCDELLFVGRLVEKKGLRYLLDAMPVILKAHPSAYLTVAGFGPEESALRQQVERLRLGDKVHFLGAVRQADLPGLYRRAVALVAPFVQAASGDQEGLGLVVVEALGCGCSCVVSELPATRELIADVQGVHGVQSGQVDQLAAVICALLDGRLQTVVEPPMQFDWSKRASVYANLLATVVCRRKAAVA